MYDLTYRQEKIQEKRKQTPFRDYLKEIVSRQPVGFYKNQGLTSRYPVSDRIGKLVPFTEEIDPTKFVIETPSSDFFSDLQQLRRLMPLANLCQYDTITNENALYSDLTAGSRNVYLSIATWIECENVLYAFDVRYLSKNIQNSLCIYQSENIYSSVSVTNGYNVFFSKSINNSSNIRYSIGMNGCSECIECENMDNTSYCIKNQQLTKEEYFTQKEKILKERVKSYQNNFTNLTGKLLER
ncbi:MAG: hypothetical protein LBP53_04240 [Candidatus Peribacteria bacterium]|jgi:hypothetical protein|nr:hypothetical protein [Candidatus Peribacteria bacterium]